MNGKGLLEDTAENGYRDGDEGTADHQAEENGDDVVERAHLAGGKAQRLEHRLETVTHVHEEAADGHDVEGGAPHIGECSHDVAVAVVGVTVHRELPQVEQQEAENHDTGEHHGTGGKSSLEGTFLLVLGAGIHVLNLQHQREHHMDEQNGGETETDSPEQPGGHGVQAGGIGINPGGYTIAGITTVDGHVTGQMPHEEQEETRTSKGHKNLATDRGRDELACCRDNIVHKRNNVFAALLYRISPEIASPNQRRIPNSTTAEAEPAQKFPTEQQIRHQWLWYGAGRNTAPGATAAARSTAPSPASRNR